MAIDLDDRRNRDYRCHNRTGDYTRCRYRYQHRQFGIRWCRWCDRQRQCPTGNNFWRQHSCQCGCRY
ncbi:hypothetical protein [Parasphingorhabdus sp.]|uniref:hypothetical protein n=1 Tax=Parasphingorhabdus sp. TaxID=2709688 RepID=UPI003A907719